MPKGKKILLGITGGIAAYKIPLLIRLLVKNGAEVKVITTNSALDFVTPLTLATLSKHQIYHQLFNSNTGEWTNHVELGAWADLMVIAPASANTIAKMSYGMADNLLLTTYLSAKCEVMFAPAMDLDMYKHPSVKQNIEVLCNQRNILIKPNTGELASGLYGEGRMAEPEEIFNEIRKYFENHKRFEGKKVVVSAGPTYESIDPVRFVGNYSTGKMGIEIAETFKRQGADVVLVCGPSQVNSSSSIKRIDVVSATQMQNKVQEEFVNCDIMVMSAAVADYRPQKSEPLKIKKKSENIEIKLVKNVDILKSLGESKTKKQFLVGFALETNNELENAKEKLQKKNLDLIVLNSLNDKGAGFGMANNKVTLINKSGKISNFSLKSKEKVAEDIVNEIYNSIQKNDK